MIKEKREISKTIKLWSQVSKVVSTIHSTAQYNKMVNILDSLIDEVGKKSDPVKESLIDTLGTLIKHYEDRNINDPISDPIGSLKYLIEEHKLNQNDLKEIGSQGVISEILNGKRKLNLRQIIELSKKFSVSPSVFLENPGNS